VGTHRAPSLFRRWKGFWRKPVVWVTGIAGTVAVVVLVAMTTDVADPLVDKIFPPVPIKVVSVTWMTGPELGPDGYVIPAETVAGTNENELKSFLEKPSDGYAQWLANHGAVSVGAAVWQVVIEGGLRTELLLVGMRPVLDGSCSPPAPGGNLIEAVSEGPVGQVIYDTDIDAKEPVFIRVDVDARLKPAFTDLVIRLPRGVRNPLLFRANSRGPHCRFRIELTYLADGHNHSMMLTAPGGRPFEVTGHASYEWVYRPPIVCGKVARVPGQGWNPSSTKCS
jgi:hypothetical protein